MSENHNTNRYVCIDSTQLQKMAVQFQTTYEMLEYERRMAQGLDTFYAVVIIAIMGIAMIPQIANLIN